MSARLVGSHRCCEPRAVLTAERQPTHRRCRVPNPVLHRSSCATGCPHAQRAVRAAPDFTPAACPARSAAPAGVPLVAQAVGWPPALGFPIFASWPFDRIQTSGHLSALSLTLTARCLSRLRGSVGGSPPSQGVGWILGSSPDANGAMLHAAAERHRRYPKVRTWQMVVVQHLAAAAQMSADVVYVLAWLLAVNHHVPVLVVDLRSGLQACSMRDAADCSGDGTASDPR